MIERDELCKLIPHAGSMCLLDEVESWNNTSIKCTANSHHEPQNPLYQGDYLTAVHAIEYGAQAMAVHGGLLARANNTQSVPGFIAALRDIRLHVDYLHDQDAPLCVLAHVLLQNPSAMIYRFQITAGDIPIADGRITVMTVS